MSSLGNILHPERFQGAKKTDRYFEGWYFKLVSRDERHTIALIPGVSVNREDPHAFIQVFLSRAETDGTSLSTRYLRYGMDQFKFEPKRFSISIGNCAFTHESITLDLADPSVDLRGTVSFSDFVPIRKTIFMPNIMGLFGYFSFMECYHGVISMTHMLHGKLLLDGETIDFDGGKGYIEKDWGRSFPRAYVWMQSNHFTAPGTSLMFSYADIPFLGLHFKGLIANLLLDGKEYRFATYNFARVVGEDVRDGSVFYRLKKGCYALEVDAFSDRQIGLASPRNGRMVEQIKEGLSGVIRFRLFRGKKIIAEDTGRHAGIEIMKRKPNSD
ncbi:MAG: tocopherol cyclase family protein [Bacillota bacterium]|nr:tocopherol cyclase family protein [Bacillota bacterium]